MAIDYRNEDFLARVRELTGDGVDVVLDGIGGAVSLRSFRALRPGGRLVVYGRHEHASRTGARTGRAVIEWYAATATVALWGLLSPRRRVLAYRIQKLRIPHQDWFREDFRALLELLRRGQDPPGRGRAPAAVRCAPRARAARELGGEGKARARAIGRGRPMRRPGEQVVSAELAAPRRATCPSPSTA